MVNGFGDMSSLLKQAQEMKRRLDETQHALAERVIEGSAGGGVVKVRVTGNRDLHSVHIDPAVVDPADASGLEDLVAAAARQALAKAKELHDIEMAKVTGGMHLPGFGF
jgi:DNA-binding YbaB/EbfC family protein